MKQKIKNRIKNKLNLKLESRFNFQVTETGKLMSNLRSSEEDFSNFSFNVSLYVIIIINKSNIILFALIHL